MRLFTSNRESYSTVDVFDVPPFAIKELVTTVSSLLFFKICCRLLRMQIRYSALVRIKLPLAFIGLTNLLEELTVRASRPRTGPKQVVTPRSSAIS